LDEAGNPVASTLIINKKIVDYSTEKLQATLDNGLAGWVVRERKAVLIPDTSKDERWLHRPDDDRDATGPKSVVSAPLVAQDRLSGVITLVHPEPGSFSPHHKDLIQAIADQSAVAVMNARLHADTLHQARIMTALSESATAITGSLELSEVLQRILAQISQALNAEAVSLAMLDQEDETLEYYASTYKGKQNLIGLKFKLGQGIAGWVAKEKTGVIISNAYEDDRFDPYIDEITGFKTRASACSPIHSQGEIIGTVEAINPQSGKFDPEALEVLNGISSLAGTVIRHAQLFEAHQAAHKRYHDLFEENITSIILTDWHGEILEVNIQTTQLSHYSKEKLQASFIEMLHDVNRDVLGMDFENVSEDRVTSYESVLYTSLETEIPITVHVQPVLIEGKSCLQWVFRDDTERKELEKLREDLLSMIYHDLRSPLANIVSSLDVLNTMVDFNKENPTIHSLFDIAMRSTKRIQRLTHSMLDINRLEAGQPVIDKNPASIKSLLIESIDALQPIIENKKLEVVLDIPEKIPLVLINWDMIQRVIINLIENALKYTPPDGMIKIGAQQSTNAVRLWVQDSGPGIPEENRQNIFDKYTRLHGKGGGKGYGLGLAYCRLAVEGHGGNIWAENTPGGGSIFTFTLPLYTEGKTTLAE